MARHRLTTRRKEEKSHTKQTSPHLSSGSGQAAGGLRRPRTQRNGKFNRMAAKDGFKQALTRVKHSRRCGASRANHPLRRAKCLLRAGHSTLDACSGRANHQWLFTNPFIPLRPLRPSSVIFCFLVSLCLCVRFFRLSGTCLYKNRGCPGFHFLMNHGRIEPCLMM